MSDLVKMQFAQSKALLMQHVLTFILLKKLLFYLQMVELYKDIGFKVPNCYFGKVNARSNFATQFTDVGGHSPHPPEVGAECRFLKRG